MEPLSSSTAGWTAPISFIDYFQFPVSPIAPVLQYLLSFPCCSLILSKITASHIGREKPPCENSNADIKGKQETSDLF